MQIFVFNINWFSTISGSRVKELTLLWKSGDRPRAYKKMDFVWLKFLFTETNYIPNSV